MKVIVFFFLCLVVEMVSAQLGKEAEAAIRNGADAKYEYHVVDDEGMPVADATAHIWFKSYGRPQDNADWTVRTDTNGMFTVQHRLNERFSVGVDKEGHYHASDEIYYLGMNVLPIKDGKWQPYGEKRRIVLKKIRKPVDMLHKPCGCFKIPSEGSWLGFDLERQSWVNPHGEGRVSDVLIRFRNNVVNSQTKFTATMEVCFTNNAHAGFYVCKKDLSSEMLSDYTANTNAEYITSKVFSLHRLGKQRIDGSLSEDSYLVFRTRTKVDSQGRLISAHYGKIYGRWGFYRGMRTSGIWFNPEPNSTNLEDKETADRVRLLYRQRTKVP